METGSHSHPHASYALIPGKNPLISTE